MNGLIKSQPCIIFSIVGLFDDSSYTANYSHKLFEKVVLNINLNLDGRFVNDVIVSGTGSEVHKTFFRKVGRRKPSSRLHLRYQKC